MIDLKHSPNTKLLWVDLEMTGLDPVKDRIIEVAAIVTDFSFKEYGTYTAQVKQDYKIVRRQMLKNMFWRDQLAKNGDRIENFLARMEQFEPAEKIEKELATFIKKYFKDEPAVLAGNSIHCDRSFIKQWWPEVEKLLHYRMLDVSSFKVLMLNKYGIEFNKKETHQALSDINESIDELKYYLDYFKAPTNKSQGRTLEARP